VPILTQMVPGPLFVEIGRGAVDKLESMLAQLGIVSFEKVLVAVSNSQAVRMSEHMSQALPGAHVRPDLGRGLVAAQQLAEIVRLGSYQTLVAVGGGSTIDVAKYAADATGVSLVVVATNLAHDGLCSPVASLEHDGGKGSYGVALPHGVLIDLDYVSSAPPELLNAGIGDVLSNISAIDDWMLAHNALGEEIHGLAIAHARTAAEAILGHPSDINDPEFLRVLAEALVLSGMAMAVAGTSRPCSGACHEIVHAIEELYPGSGLHGELAGVGAVFATHLRGDTITLARLVRCLRRHHLPVLPEDLGLTNVQFVTAAAHAPGTRPGRYTVLEHRELSVPQLTAELAATSSFVKSVCAVPSELGPPKGA
jgi:glycerol-1-phosphate dehydrogenase [NAD(P)+]